MQLLPSQGPRGRDTPPSLGSDLISGIDIQSTKGGCSMCQFPLVNLASSGVSSIFQVQLSASVAWGSSENDSKFVLREPSITFYFLVIRNEELYPPSSPFHYDARRKCSWVSRFS